MELDGVGLNGEELVRDIYKSLVGLGEKKEVEVDLKEKVGESVRVEGEGLGIGEIVEKVVWNGVKFRGGGGIRVEGE